MKNNTITSPKGFRAGASACGLKDSGNPDLGVLVADAVCPAAAVFTNNRFCGAPVVVGREHIRKGRLRAMVVNSGCSNVATGKRGIADARKMCRLAAQIIDADESDVLPFSTGVIGEFLPMKKVERGIEQALALLSGSAASGRRFARAILTTDTKIKQACEVIRLGKERITIAGCCKGSGMIAPNMATMLGFITTDAQLAAGDLKGMLKAAVDPTFNRVTVDECESTSDAVAIMASGLGGVLANTRAKLSFKSALLAVCESLAYQIVADGEGASKVMEVKVSGAGTAKDAHAAARAVAVSPLVKTAVNGGDPNWGRIVQALGATKVTYRPERVTVRLDGTIIFTKGAPARKLDQGKLARIMKQKQVNIKIDLGAGKFNDRVLTCDLSREYVTINADYHT
ncbi:MAG: bifunctional glutamate N-acetyltransferase/amino-acid acetyltransferase ArgJ [Planctomycetota bacterium]|jgi:glutamate N-acetyltransferase/amino-acid N-acetyltransferase